MACCLSSSSWTLASKRSVGMKRPTLLPTSSLSMPSGRGMPAVPSVSPRRLETLVRMAEKPTASVLRMPSGPPSRGMASISASRPASSISVCGAYWRAISGETGARDGCFWRTRSLLRSTTPASTVATACTWVRERGRQRSVPTMRDRGLRSVPTKGRSCSRASRPTVPPPATGSTTPPWGTIGSRPDSTVAAMVGCRPAGQEWKPCG